MPQFTVYKNINEKSRNAFPYLLDVQNDILLTSQLAGIPKSEPGPQVYDLSEQRNVIISALDFLFTGF